MTDPETFEPCAPCPFCGGTKVTVEGKGQNWRGVKGWSDPQYWLLVHHGTLGSGTFEICFVQFRGRTREAMIEYWNNRIGELA